MKQKINLNIFSVIKLTYTFSILLLFLFSLQFSFAAIDYSKYEYQTQINLECDEYIGYSKFELPLEYLNLKSPKSYMDTKYSIENSKAGTYYVEQNNWYVKTLKGYKLSNTENIYNENYKTNLQNMYDNNFYSSFIALGINNLSFNFENPETLEIKKISLDIKDSSIDSIKIFDSSKNKIPFTLNKDKFHYELILNTPISTNFLSFKLKFKDVLKIREINFLSQVNYKQKSFVYFYNNNQCNKTYNFYFGEFGKNYAEYGQKELPVEFKTIISTNKNPLYNSDFDSDNILNKDDNCLNIKNSDQKDINYNNIGDACEDFDSDGVYNTIDNCLEDYNPDQLDNDNDGIGNICDTEDSRFLEKNNYLIYIISAIIGIIFLGFSIITMRKR